MFSCISGENASNKREERGRKSDGQLVVIVPDSDREINVVTQCKHLGGIICVDGNVVPDARAKAASAMAAYGPLAMMICGSPRIGADLKFSFLWALVLTRLLFNIHIVVPNPKCLAIINGVYMRGLRRI